MSSSDLSPHKLDESPLAEGFFNDVASVRRRSKIYGVIFVASRYSASRIVPGAPGRTGTSL